MSIEYWMSAVGVSMCLASIPQGIRIYQRKSSADISLLLWILMLHGIFWWLYYGISIGSTSLIITNSLAAFLDTIVLLLIFKYRQPQAALAELEGK